MSSSSEERGPVGLLADEFLARCKRGERPTIKEYCDRRPDLAGEIRDVFEALLMVEDLRPGADEVSGSAGESAPVGGKRLQQVGDYRILGEIGRGGMGVVYEAEQQALGRRVALKVLPRTSAGDGSAQIRFQREAKAAARMHHTNIVPVFDVGQDGDSLYYAMQLIHGQGLDLVIEDLKRLRAQSTVVPASHGVAREERSIAASLAAGKFEQENLAAPDPAEADATAAYGGSAPSSAVLPGQSELSTAAGNRGAYFRSVGQIGVQTAAALSYAHGRGIIHRDIKPGNLILDTTGNVWVTDFGLAKTGDGGMTHTGDILGTVPYMSPERFRGQCDVRADVYALGMTLYELLTLRPAYASGDRLRLIEQIRQSEAASPRSVDGRVPRDLETIVMKAIDKDPKRRYQSADEMGEDLQRFVNDEPIRARRVGSAERLGRWCRRNSAVAGLMAAVLALMAAGTAVSTWQAVAANRARADLAAKNAALANEQAKVQARFDMAMKAIALFHTGVSEDMLLKNPEFEGLRTKLLKEAADFYADLEKLLAGQTDAKSRKTLAEGYFQLAELTDKIGDKKQALAVHRKALALRRELAAAEGADVETRLDVAHSLDKVGELLGATGDHAGALAAYEEERDLAERLEVEYPTDAVRSVLGQGHRGVGFMLSETGKPEAAQESYRKAVAIQQKLADANPAVTQFQSDLAHSHHVIGWMLIHGKPEEGLTECRKALAIRQKLADANPAVTAFQRDLAESHHSTGWMLHNTGKPDEALTEYRTALAVSQKLADANPAVTQFQYDLALSHNGIGGVLSQSGKPEEALTEFRKSSAIFQKLADANPAVTESQRQLAWSHGNIGRMLSQTGKLDEALTEYRKALAIFQKLADANPAVPGFQGDLAWRHCDIAGVLSQTGKPEEALTELRKAVAIQQKLADANPAVTQFQSDLAGSHNSIGDFLSQTGKPWEALTEYRLALAIFQKLADANAAVTEFQRALAWDHYNIGRLLSQTGKPEEALTELRQALAIRQKLADANPASTQLQSELAQSHNDIGLVLARTGKPEEALKYLEERLQLLKAKHGPDHPATLAALDGVAFGYLAVAAQQAWLGQEQEWAATCERGLSLAQDTKNVRLADKVAKMCSLRPSNDKRRRAALLLARRAVELGKGNPFLPYFQMALGMAEYRSGHFAEADAALLAAMDAGKDNPHIAGTSAFYRALSLFRQAKPDEARQLATQAAAKMKPLPKDEQNPLTDQATFDDLILWLAYKEAKALIGFDTTQPAPPEKAPPASEKK